MTGKDCFRRAALEHCDRALIVQKFAEFLEAAEGES